MKNNTIMQKIMFNEKYGLTAAVLQDRKTMTRRLVKDANLLQWLHEMEVAEYSIKGTIVEEYSPYKVGEVVAIAMAYKNFYGDIKEPLRSELVDSEGFFNKMFVKADLMPHRIRITDLKVERMQDISDEDCLKEGVFQWRDMEDCPKNSSEVMKSRYGFYGVWYAYGTPREAFAALIDKVSGRGTWKRNPWVFAYTFELVK